MEKQYISNPITCYSIAEINMLYEITKNIQNIAIYSACSTANSISYRYVGSEQSIEQLYAALKTHEDA